MSRDTRYDRRSDDGSARTAVVEGGMRRWLIPLAMAFWAALLGASVLRLWKSVDWSPEGAYLVAIPAVMIAITAYTAKAARDPRLTPGAISSGSVIAAFATLMWFGILGAGV